MGSSNQASSDIENPYIVKQNELGLRSCYAETIGFDTDEFVKIILVDSAFIIEPDLRLLENQLPFFILEEVYKPDKISLPSGHTEKPSIIKLAHKFFTTLMHLEGTETKLEQIKPENVAHFVDFLRTLYIPLNPRDGEKFKSLNAPSMTELHRAGVKFRVASSKNLFDIHFNNGILKIPKLTISDEIELTIRNLLAFEQCHCVENYLNDYVVIMDRLVNTPKDVDLLVKYGIVENRLGDSSEGASLINKLADGVIMDSDDFYFAGICKALNDYCSTSWHKWKANLNQNYFNTPWAIVSVTAAILLLILTIIQAVCSILQVKDSPP
ncbi:hypothetical protein FEM48_Zijuj06G0145700 [Ziziphus jujuba var. spinosa]|uniref:Uncharacterized protein n=1 Tax=Ziziphus jujuba var. spinosa TaxID=714518 RepID=A0A978V9U8_ZIZJJ|nr:hypothetical protein FEM48_Zijuj06G0145700 [Ziziphus jujuba var. spinosa]